MNQTEAAAGLAVWVAAAASPSVRAALLRERGARPASAAEGAASAVGRRADELVPLLAELTAELADLDHVVVAGPSLAARAAAGTVGRSLTVLDSADPGPVRRALADRLDRTVIVSAGSSDEVDAIRRVYASALRAAGLSEAEVERRFVTADLPADLPAVGRVLAADLVPAALARVDVAELLDQADGLRAVLGRDTDNPGLALAAALREASAAGRRTVALVSDGTGLVGLAEWVARLLDETTDFVPVVLESPDAPVAGDTDVLTVTLGGALLPGTVPGGGVWPDVAVNGPLGAQFAVWEYATAALAPPDSPMIKASLMSPGSPSEQVGAVATNHGERPEFRFGLLEGRLDHEDGEASFVEGAIAGYGTSAGGVTEAIGGLLLATRPDSSLVVSAHLDRHADAALAGIRRPLAEIAGRPVAFAWGMSHPAGGAHLQITGASTTDLAVPGTPYTLGDLAAARAGADRAALARRERPVTRLHLTDRSAGIKQLLDAINALRN